MAFDLSETDHGRLDKMLDFILELYAEGEVSIEEARSALAHIVAAAAIDNEGEVLAWLNPEQLTHWKEEVIAHRP